MRIIGIWHICLKYRIFRVVKDTVRGRTGIRGWYIKSVKCESPILEEII